ncbi:MAG: sigma 54-interacting transcriptional regulator [Pseudomonadota bacterium]
MFLRTVATSSRSNRMVGSSKSMAKVQELIKTVAPTKASVLIVGETGTGKELVAKAIHDLSKRKEKPFIAINCAAMGHSLWQSEMFGHEKGAFTGALKTKMGRFELADKGTFFLTKFPSCRSLFRSNC